MHAVASWRHDSGTGSPGTWLCAWCKQTTSEEEAQALAVTSSLQVAHQDAATHENWVPEDIEA